MDIDARLQHLFENQLGLISRQQALAAGLSDRALQTRCDSGRWQRRRRGVYALAGVPLTAEQQVLAACLAVEGSLVSHDTARALWTDQPLGGGQIELTVVGDRHVKQPDLRVHRTDRLSGLDRATRRRIPVTSAERLVVDLSGRLDVGELGGLVDDLLRRRRLSLRRLAACLAGLEAAPGRRPAVVHEVLQLRGLSRPPGESAWERRVVDVLVTAGLPRPVMQHRVSIGGRRYRVDLAYVELGLIIELDSWTWHQGYESFHRDRRRLSDLVAAGFRVLTLTPQMTDAELVALVSGAIESCGARPA